MSKVNETPQMKTWSGEFGKAYTDRNPQTAAEVENLYLKQFGMTRIAMNEEFIGNLSRDMRILEVGANVGIQLMTLQKMGFKNLYGIELQQYAVEKGKQNSKNINLIQGYAFDIPFKDGYFDLVYTSGVLIHISPNDIHLALKEIHRCSSKYIWGLEYYADEYTEGGDYRGHRNLFWKTNFANEYLKLFEDLEVVKEKKYKYLDNDNLDIMFLFQKKNAPSQY